MSSETLIHATASHHDVAPKSPGETIESGDHETGYPEQRTLPENNRLPSFSLLLQSQSDVPDLEVRLRYTRYTCNQLQYKLRHLQRALQKEFQYRVIFQQQVRIEEHKHSETIQLYKVALQDLQQERNISEMQKKVISDQEDLIGIYQAGYQPVGAQSETVFTTAAVDAPLPAMRSEGSIGHEYHNVETPANQGRHQTFSKGAMHVLPVTDSNNHGFGYVTNLSSSPNTVSTREMAPLPIEIRSSSGFPLVGKDTPAPLSRIDEVDYEDHDFDFVMDPDFNQFPTSSLRDTPCMTGITEHDNKGHYNYDKGETPILAAGLGSKRSTEEGGKRKRRKAKSSTVVPSVN